MFKFKKAFPVIIALSLLTGCAGNIRFQDSAPRPQAGLVEYSVKRDIRAPEKAFSGAKSIGSNSQIYYFQNFGGGGMGVGLLLGPIGVAANAGMIASKTNEEASFLKDKLAINPAELVSKVMSANSNLKQSDNGSGFELFPYVLIVKGENNQLHFTTTLDAVSGPWKGRYSYHIESTYPLASIKNGLNSSQYEQLSKDIEHGFNEASALFERDIKGQLSPIRDVTFYSEPTSPRIKMPVFAKLVAEENNEVIVLGPGGTDQLNLILASGYHKLSKSHSEIINR